MPLGASRAGKASDFPAPASGHQRAPSPRSPKPRRPHQPASHFQNDTGTVTGDQGQAIATCCEKSGLVIPPPDLRRWTGVEWRICPPHDVAVSAGCPALRWVTDVSVLIRAEAFFFFFSEKSQHGGGRRVSVHSTPWRNELRGAQRFSVVCATPRTSSCRPHALPFIEEGSHPFRDPCLLDEVIHPLPSQHAPASCAGVAFYRCVVVPCFPSLSPTCQRPSQIGQGAVPAAGAQQALSQRLINESKEGGGS